MKKNTKNVTPKNGADPPPKHLDACSYTGLEEFALGHPQALARGTGKTAVVRTLHRKEVGGGRPLTIRLLDVDPRYALVVIDFGDGSLGRQKTVASHVYRESGCFHVTIGVIDSGADHRGTFGLAVKAGEGAVNARIRISKPPPYKPLPPVSAGPCPDDLIGPSQCGAVGESVFATWAAGAQTNNVCIYLTGPANQTGDVTLNGPASGLPATKPFSIGQSGGTMVLFSVDSAAGYGYTVRRRQADGSFKTTLGTVAVGETGRGPAPPPGSQPPACPAPY